MMISKECIEDVGMVTNVGRYSFEFNDIHCHGLFTFVLIVDLLNYPPHKPGRWECEKQWC